MRKKLKSKKLSHLCREIEGAAELSASEITRIRRLLSKLEHSLKVGNSKSALKAINQIAEIFLVDG